MIHLGDITKINGAEIEPVDCITGGSPCQDLSVAGKRAGLAGERSGLFMEQIRVIKEMRQHEKECGRADEFIRPRWMVWENVPGAFSSNDGEDFRAVLEETARIVDETAVIPRPPKGKWASAGCIMGDGWSIAWRVHDAQFWGVPQRRKRIALVADFAGGAAPEVLFERKSMSRNPSPGTESREETPGDIGESTNQTISFQERAGKPGGGKGILIQNEHVGALSTLNNQSVVYGISAYDSNAMKSGNPNSGVYKAETARTLDLNGGSPACNQGGMAVVSLEGNGSRPSHSGDGYSESEVMYTLNSTEHHAVCSAEINGGGYEEPTTISKASFFLNARSDGKSDTLVATDYKDPQIVCYGLDRASFNQGQNAQFGFSVQEDLAQTIVAKGPGGY